MKTCPFCEQETIQYFNVILKNLPVVRKKLVCLNCKNELATKLGFVSNLFVLTLEVIVLFALIFFFIALITKTFSIKYLGVLVISIGVKMGFMAVCPVALKP